MGIRANSIQWGAWANAGMAAQSSTTKARFQRMGVGFITPLQGLAALSAVLATRSAAVTAAGVMDWSRYLQNRSKPLPAFFEEVAGQLNGGTAAESVAAPSMAVIHSTHSNERDARQVSVPTHSSITVTSELVAIVGSAVEKVMGATVSADSPLMAAGIDSSGAVELRDTLQEALGIQLPSTLLFDYPTITSIAARSADLAQHVSTRSPARTLQQREALPEMGPTARAETTLQDVQAQLVRIVSQVMGTDVGAAEPLMAAGLDSLGSVELRDNIQEAFGVQLVPTLAMDYPTINAISHHLLSLLPQAPATGGGILAAPSAGSTALLRHPQAGRGRISTAMAILGMASESPIPTQPTPGPQTGSTPFAAPYGSCDAVGRIPTSRWDAELQGRMAGLVPGRFASLLGQVEAFDGDALGVAHVEASLMDPQQRILLEAATEVWLGAKMEVMGTQWANGCGVFVGASWMDYGLLLKAHQGITPYSGTGSASSAISGRLAYTFGLQGPAASGEQPHHLLRACSSDRPLSPLHLLALHT